MKDWLHICKRLVQIAWSLACGFYRSSTPSLMTVSAITIAYGLGDFGFNAWWTLVPVLLAAFAVDLAKDRAEARAASEWAERFWKLIETDHVLEVSVTHNTPSQKVRAAL